MAIMLIIVSYVGVALAFLIFGFGIGWNAAVDNYGIDESGWE
jgi:hypothetical protein